MPQQPKDSAVEAFAQALYDYRNERVTREQFSSVSEGTKEGFRLEARSLIDRLKLNIAAIPPDADVLAAYQSAFMTGVLYASPIGADELDEFKEMVTKEGRARALEYIKAVRHA